MKSTVTMTPFLCELFKPPPMPPEGSPGVYNQLIGFINSNKIHEDNYRFYCKACNVTFPSLIPNSSASTAALTGYTETTETSSPSNTTQSTYTSLSTEIVSGATTAVASGSIAGIVIACLVIVVIILFVFGIWYKKFRKHGSETITNPRLQELERINYLDNKARLNICWKGSKTHEEVPSESVRQNDYITMEPSENRDSQLCTDLKKDAFSLTTLKIDSGNEESRTGCDNRNFEADEATPSPGVSSQTPLFGDDIDGTLPNVPDKHNEDGEVTLRSTSRNGHLKKSDNSLPPIGNGARLSTQSETFKKNKKYLTRKSEPVNGLDEIMQGENRKTF